MQSNGKREDTNDLLKKHSPYGNVDGQRTYKASQQRAGNDND